MAVGGPVAVRDDAVTAATATTGDAFDASDRSGPRPDVHAGPVSPPRWWMLFLPSVFAIANAVAFVVVRPGVNDLWAARARASAVHHGVGLFYWFGWFGGGSAPGNYSIVTPYLCAWLGTEVVGALAAVAVTVLAALAVRDCRHPVVGASVAAVAAAANLWSGRIPFLLGCAVGVGALLAVMRRRRLLTVVLTLASMLASPVSGAFLAMGLSGTFVTTRTRDWRPIIAYAAITTLVGLGGVAVLFGAPGPEPFSFGLLLEMLGGLLVLLVVARPPDHLRTTLYLTAVASVVLWVVPNGMGSNFARFVWFCLPVAVVATSSRRRVLATLAAVPLLAMGGSQTVIDLRDAGQPVATVGYYAPLASRLDAIPALADCRLEVVNFTSHAGYDQLLGHAALARGWMTQADQALNAPLKQDPLSPVAYKAWLDNNAVCYVALPAGTVDNNPEYALVSSGSATYLHRVWRDARWQLFRVTDPTPIVASPGRIVGHTQSSMTIDVSCACRIDVRIRFSKFLVATLQRPGPAVTGDPEVTATLADDSSGWTAFTAPRPGRYLVTGTIGGLIR